MNINKQKDPNATRKVGRFIGFGALTLVLVIVLASSFVVVPAGHSGVVLTLGRVSDNVMTEGFHFKIPFVQQVENISNKIQKNEVEAAAVSKDLQTVSSNVAVNYRVSNASSASIYQNIGRAYEDVVLLPAVQESMKSVSAKYTAEELITKREAVSQEIKDTLESKVNEYGIIIEKFNIVNFDFSAEFNAAIEAKQVAEQNLLKTKTEQEQALVIAKTEAEKKVLEAEAQAEAIRVQAEAQAEANRLLTASLSETLVEYEKVQKWDGKLPVVSDGNAIVDIGDVAGGN